MVSTFYRVIEEFITYGDFDRDSLLLQGIDGLNIYGDAFKDDSFKCKLLVQAPDASHVCISFLTSSKWSRFIHDLDY
uniref:Uncharacterized protein n=1 Tax=Physcomitrium patens TaxID=3218 RepID=A0A2K1IVR7_PHYPA|nr:hypothetical protein PHYPA_025315 [Physcomitrium patens]